MELRRCPPAGTMSVVSAEQLIAIEAALGELSTLYAVARGFTALQARAESELFPSISALGRRLRGLLRTAQLTPEQIDAAAREMVALGSQWRVELEQVRAAAVYQQARAALAADRQAEIADLIPQIVAGVRRLHPAPPLYFPVSPSAGRRRPGASPFLSATECADRILRLLEEGITPEGGGTEWWECDLPFLSAADTPTALDTPVTLRLASPDSTLAVFAEADEPLVRIFTPRLRAPMSIVLAREATDEWWEAYEDSYHSFRDALREELAARGHLAAIDGGESKVAPKETAA